MFSICTPINGLPVMIKIAAAISIHKRSGRSRDLPIGFIPVGFEAYEKPDATPADIKGFWATLGSGNRNRTPGDSIFHCHLYPHFAQGMWALWRNHDVLEDGTRFLPDGQKDAGLSTTPRPP